MMSVPRIIPTENVHTPAWANGYRVDIRRIFLFEERDEEGKIERKRANE